MTLAEAKAKLSTMEGGAELLAAFDGELSTVRTEAGTHRVKAKEASDRLASLAKRVGVDPGAEDFEAALEAIKKPVDGGTLKSQIATLTKTVEKLTSDKTQEIAKRRSVQSRQSVLEALQKANALAPEDIASLVLPNAVVGEDDQVQWKNPDGTMGSVEDGVKAWLTGKPYFVKSNQQQGPGGPKIPGVPPGVATITRSQYDQNRNDPKTIEKISKGELRIVND